MDTTAPTTQACHADLNALIALCVGMREHLGANDDGPPISTKPFARWLKKAEALAQDSALETLKGERKLETLTMELRHLWLQAVHGRSDRYLMTPPQTQFKHLPGGELIHYPYDRWLKPAGLENRLAAASPTPKGWQHRALLFNSAMVAITTFLQAYRGLGTTWWPEHTNPVHLHWWGGYFEVTTALKLLCDHRFIGRKHATQAKLFKHIEQSKTDLIVLEPVVAALELEVFDLDAFVEAWKKRTSTRPVTILVDTSLLGDAFSMKNFCERLSFAPPALIVEIRSGLKLDQQGLELTNVGLMNLWAPDQPEQGETLNKIVHALQISRTTFGGGLSHNDVAALQAPLFLDPNLLHDHVQAVFAANRDFAHALNAETQPETGVFDQVFHPSLTPALTQPWAQAPYVNLRYRPDDDSARAFLKNLLDMESQRRKLCFWSASSFGFRSHRYEMGYARGIKHETLRIALGARQGPSFHGVLSLFKEIAHYPDFQALREAYPHITGANLTDQRENED